MREDGEGVGWESWCGSRLSDGQLWTVRRRRGPVVRDDAHLFLAHRLPARVRQWCVLRVTLAVLFRPVRSSRHVLVVVVVAAVSRDVDLSEVVDPLWDLCELAGLVGRGRAGSACGDDLVTVLAFEVFVPFLEGLDLALELVARPRVVSRVLCAEDALVVVVVAPRESAGGRR